MKAIKTSKRSDLPVDVLEYMFTEWLVRRGLFSAYKENFQRLCPNHRSFRDNLRAKLLALYRSPHLGVENIISTSFLYTMTSEGYDFWTAKSNLWRCFCRKFKSTL